MQCPACGKSLPPDAVYCLACGRRLPGTNAPAGTPAREHVGKTCPYCQTPLKPSDQAVVCPHCSMPHHRDCWQDNGGCTTYGCGTAAAPSPAVPHDDDRIDLTDQPLPLMPVIDELAAKKGPHPFVITLAILAILIFIFIVYVTSHGTSQPGYSPPAPSTPYAAP